MKNFFKRISASFTAMSERGRIGLVVGVILVILLIFIVT